jgi:hypothetical protein
VTMAAMESRFTVRQVKICSTTGARSGSGTRRVLRGAQDSHGERL